MHNTKQECRCQVEAFMRLHGNELDLIAEYAEEFREIINSFEACFGRCPSASDLIWIVSERRGLDITKEGTEG